MLGMTAAHETTGVPDFTPGDRYRRARLNAGQRNVQEFATVATHETTVTDLGAAA